MIELLLDKANLNQAYERVKANKGAGGVDGLQVSDLKAHLQTHGTTLTSQIRAGSYQPSPIKGVEIPKSNDERMIPQGECPQAAFKRVNLEEGGRKTTRRTHGYRQGFSASTTSSA